MSTSNGLCAHRARYLSDGLAGPNESAAAARGALSIECHGLRIIRLVQRHGTSRTGRTGRTAFYLRHRPGPFFGFFDYGFFQGSVVPGLNLVGFLRDFVHVLQWRVVVNAHPVLIERYVVIVEFLIDGQDYPIFHELFYRPLNGHMADLEILSDGADCAGREMIAGLHVVVETAGVAHCGVRES